VDSICNMKELHTLRWNNSKLVLLDQTALPLAEKYIECHNYRRVAEAIRRLEVRGAPAIGAAAAYGLLLGAMELQAQRRLTSAELHEVGRELKATRPTAVNLAWAVDRLLQMVDTEDAWSDDARIVSLLIEHANRISDEDRACNEAMADFGATLITSPMAVLTHCNAGALATVDVGTALGVIHRAWEHGHITRVYADETRPLLQGSRLTTYELSKLGIPVTLITDSMAGWVMKTGKVDAVFVGADRITRNGDVANKIGTYTVAVLANAHQLPFYVAAPISSFDFSIADGDEIPIEERHPDEVRKFAGMQTAPSDVAVFNPAFDVTPAALVTAIITERGVLRPPFPSAIQKMRDEWER
jgi:methylthioribose-1-phosphate isomerase